MSKAKMMFMFVANQLFKMSIKLSQTGLLICSLFFASCSNSPEKAIKSMKDKADEYMLKGVKPTIPMIIADCSDNFKKDFKSDIEWTSKLTVFEKDLIRHLDEKELFDTTKHFPKSTLSYESCRTIINNKDSFYFYCNNEVTINDLVYKNEQIGNDNRLYFLKDLNELQPGKEPVISFSVDIPTTEFDKQKIIGMPKFDDRIDYQRTEPANVYFYNEQSNRFIEEFDFAKYLYISMLKVANNDTALNRDDWGRIINRYEQGQGTDNSFSNSYYKVASYYNSFTSDDDAVAKINEVVAGNEYYVWDRNEDKSYTGPYADKVSITGQFKTVANILGMVFFINDTKILKKEDAAFQLKSMKKVNFKTGKILQ
ncbi:MAG: hypothetical protein WC716_04310 [Chitinophagaceae bacterium]